MCRADIKDDCDKPIIHGKKTHTLSISDEQLDELIFESSNLEKPQQEFYWLKDKIKKTKFKPNHVYLDDYIPGGVPTLILQVWDMLGRQYSHKEKPFGTNPHKTLNEAEINDILRYSLADLEVVPENGEEYNWLKEKLRNLKYVPHYKNPDSNHRDTNLLRPDNVYTQASNMIYRQYFRNQPVLGRFSPA